MSTSGAPYHPTAPDDIARDQIARHQKACFEFASAENIVDSAECHAEVLLARMELFKGLTEPPALAPGYVAFPRNADEAVAMSTLGLNYLTLHAPERLAQNAPEKTRVRALASGEQLARRAEIYMRRVDAIAHLTNEDRDVPDHLIDATNEGYRNLLSAIYYFRKHADQDRDASSGSIAPVTKGN